MIIRIMTTGDYDAVYTLWKATPGMGMRSLDDSREGIKKFLERNPHTCFVALNGEELEGVILSGHDGRRAYIYHAVVTEARRGSGIGRALVAAVETAMKAEGIHRIALVAYTGNASGNGFWERLGYTTRPDLVYRNRSLNDENQ